VARVGFGLAALDAGAAGFSRAQAARLITSRINAMGCLIG
jgi:hypothetical protein